MGVACVFAGCGGASHKAASTTTSTATSTTTTGTTTVAKKHAPAALAELVSIAKHGAVGSSSMSVSPGDKILFRTNVPPGRRYRVTLTVTHASNRKWTVLAVAAGQRSTATITSAAAKRITLTEVHYHCALPPSPSICPARRVSTTTTGYRLMFSVSGAVILLQADVGPIAGQLTSSPPASSLVVPPYQLSQEVAAVTPATSGPAAKPVYAPTATAKPGDTVIMTTHLLAKLIGAAQPVTVSFDQGPARLLTITATASGTAPSRATIKSASGTPISLVLPSYACFLTPLSTFCPLTSVRAGRQHYSLTFRANPHTPITLTALATAG